jgi:hypothetical protein
MCTHVEKMRENMTALGYRRNASITDMLCSFVVAA